MLKYLFQIGRVHPDFVKLYDSLDELWANAKRIVPNYVENSSGRRQLWGDEQLSKMKDVANLPSEARSTCFVKRCGDFSLQFDEDPLPLEKPPARKWNHERSWALVAPVSFSIDYSILKGEVKEPGKVYQPPSIEEKTLELGTVYRWADPVYGTVLFRDDSYSIESWVKKIYLHPFLGGIVSVVETE